MNKKFNTLFVTMLGIGNIKIIPGTFGSLATIIIIYIFFKHNMGIDHPGEIGKTVYLY